MSRDNSSLGLIETYGITAAIQAADAMCKAADVNIAGCKKVGSGLVTVYVQGEVGAVQVAVDSGVTAAKKIGRVMASLVIPRPDAAVLKCLSPLSNATKAPPADKPSAKKAVSTAAPLLNESGAQAASTLTVVVKTPAKVAPPQSVTKPPKANKPSVGKSVAKPAAGVSKTKKSDKPEKKAP